MARGGLFPQHQRDTEREAVATTCRLELHLSIPVLIEEMHNAIDAAYSVAPARLYLIEERPCHLRLPHPSGRAW